MTNFKEVITEAIPCNIVYGRPHAADAIVRALANAGYAITQTRPAALRGAVAWQWEMADYHNDERGYYGWRRHVSLTHPILSQKLPHEKIRGVTPLYPHPPAPAVTDDWLRDTAMDVMLATEVGEAVRILSVALEATPPAPKVTETNNGR